MAVTFTSAGYGGTVTQTSWANLASRLGFPYAVKSAGHWAVTVAAGDRTVSVASGTGFGHGVSDATTSAESISLAAVASGSTRWDLIVARRNWATKTTTFAVVTGGSSKALPTRNTNPGTTDDQPLALVRLASGSATIQQVIDLRCWGYAGGMTAKDDMALIYLKTPGASVLINGASWNCGIDASGNPSWTTFTAGHIPLFGASGATLIGGGNGQTLVTNGQQFLVQAGTTVNTSDSQGYARVTFQKPFPNGLLTVMGFNGDDYATGGSMTFASAGLSGGGSGSHGPSGYGSKTDWVYACRAQPASVNGTGSMVISRSGAANKIHRINWIAVGW